MFGIENAAFSRIVNLLLFQGVWFLAILGAAAGNGWIGAAGLGIFVIVHHLTSPTAKADCQLALLACLIGAFAETTLVQTHLVSYASNTPFSGFAPVWLLSLWAAFALTMNGCIAWLQNRLVLASFFGATGGPLSYFGGLKLGAATTESETILLLIIAAIYAAATPLLLYLARQSDERHISLES